MTAIALYWASITFGSGTLFIFLRILPPAHSDGQTDFREGTTHRDWHTGVGRIAYILGHRAARTSAVAAARDAEHRAAALRRRAERTARRHPETRDPAAG